MNVVFADAFYFVAWLNRRDQHHDRVISFSRNFRSRILTTDWIVMEVSDALSASESRPKIREFVHYLRQSAACEIVPASRDLIDRALDLYHQHGDKQWTLTDCISFVVMRERNVLEALTEDRHFGQVGFVALFK